MKMRFGLGVLAYLLPTFALGFVWHLMLFHGYYERLAIYRKDIIIPFGFLSMLIQALLFAWVYQRAFAAGATPQRAPEDQFYGDRNAQIRDPFGHSWFLATRIEEVSADEMQKRFDRIAKQPS